MTSKREAPARRGNDRRGRADARAGGRRSTDAPQPGRARARGGKPAAPVREPRTARTGPQTGAIGRPAPAKSASQAKARAKARKAKAPKVVRLPLRERLLNRLASIDMRPRALLAKVPFVVLVIGALGVGLGVTLWLSTDSAERSYQLSSAKEHNRVLLQQKEALEREVLEAQAAPALAEAARGLGMIPSQDTAHLVQDPAGNWVVVGSPKPAEGTALPPLNNKVPDDTPAPAAVAPPPADAVEVPVRVTPGLGAPAPVLPDAVPGTIPVAPEVMLPAPDATTPVGTAPLPGLPVPLPASDPVPGVALLPGPPPQLTVPQPVLPTPPGAALVPPVAAAAPGTAQ